MNSDPGIAGIILAAGASSRMGSPKALLTYRGETFLNRLIRILSSVCHPVIVVLGYHADAIRAQTTQGAAQFIVNPDPERGQLSSLQTALAAVPEDSSGFLFVPVDSPAAEPETLDRIAREFVDRGPKTLLVVPQFRGKHGHPVCAAPSIRTELLVLPPAGQAREVIHAHRPETRYIDVDDPGILTDVDLPEEYLRLTGSGIQAGVVK